MKRIKDFPKISWITLGATTFIGVGIIGICAGGYYGFTIYKEYTHQKQLLAQLGQNTNSQIHDLVTKVGKLILLPSSEVPTVATVSDKSKLKGEKFFANAQNGDKVLIFTQAKKAILYRPSSNKIVEVGPVSAPPVNQTASGQEVAGASTSADISPSITPKDSNAKIVLYNGTMTVGLTKKAEKELTDAIAEVEITDRLNAANQDYKKTVVVDVSGKEKKTLKTVASILNATVSSLPDGEKLPDDADILVILGVDFTQ